MLSYASRFFRLIQRVRSDAVDVVGRTCLVVEDRT